MEKKIFQKEEEGKKIEEKGQKRIDYREKAELN